MNSLEITTEFRDQLAHCIAQRDSVPAVDPMGADQWIAMSALQKGIRRGREEVAIQAAATLLLNAPDRLWRRLGGIAFEDVGLADLDAVGMTVAALAGKRFRALLGGEWAVASFVVSALTRAPKCRASDDLLMTGERHPNYATARRELATLSTRELLAICTGAEELPVRALAAWYGLGIFRPSRWLHGRRGDPQAVFDHLFNHGQSPTVVAVAREGYRRTGDPLAAFLPLLWPSRQSEPTTTADDEIPSETDVNGVPGWALDRYSRVGADCLKAFMAGNTETARWVKANVPPAGRVDFIGDVLFRTEGQVCKARMAWPTVTELRRVVDIECHRNCKDATEILALMREDMPEMNRVRVNPNGGSDHV